MKQGKWMVAALLAAGSCGQAAAGDFTVGYRMGFTGLQVDGDQLSSGNEVSDTLLSVGLDFAYRWPKGAFLEFGLASSVDPHPLLGWNDVGHASLAGGWQFDVNNWHFTPKLGITRTSLESQEEDFFEGNEPIDEIKEIVPFVEAAVEYRFWKRLGVGAYMRQNFEDFGSTNMYGVSFSWTFH